MILVDSDEYRAWHEAGHAAVCLHLGGEVYFIEFLKNHPRGNARMNCFVPDEIHRHVACAGFAAEFFLLNKGMAQQRADDDRNISQVVFHNASDDRFDFWDMPPVDEVDFSAEQDTEFMNFALRTVLPILTLYLAGMQQLASELLKARRVEGPRIRELLRPSSLR